MFADELPVHRVVLDGFWLDRTEVTNAQYRRCVQANACAASRYQDDSQFNGDDQPVVGIPRALMYNGSSPTTTTMVTKDKANQILRYVYSSTTSAACFDSVVIFNPESSAS